MQQILDEAIAMLTDGQENGFKASQGNLDWINNNGEGRKVLFMIGPPPFHFQRHPLTESEPYRNTV